MYNKFIQKRGIAGVLVLAMICGIMFGIGVPVKVQAADVTTWQVTTITDDGVETEQEITGTASQKISALEDALTKNNIVNSQVTILKAISGTIADEDWNYILKKNGSAGDNTDFSSLTRFLSGNGVRSDTVLPDADDDSFFPKTIEIVSLPSGLTRIGRNAFKGCSNLKEVIIPDSVVEFRSNVFYGCSNLKTIMIPPRVTIIPMSLFSNCTSLEKVLLPEGITGIATWAFSECHALKEIRIPDSVTWIGMFAFQNCQSLEKIAVPAGVKQLYNGIFCGCSSLKEVTLPNGITLDQTEGGSDEGSVIFKDCPIRKLNIQFQDGEGKDGTITPVTIKVPVVFDKLDPEHTLYFYSSDGTLLSDMTTPRRLDVENAYLAADDGNKEDEFWYDWKIERTKETATPYEIKVTTTGNGRTGLCTNLADISTNGDARMTLKVNSGDDMRFTFQPEEGYEFHSLLVDGGKAEVSGGQYTLSNIQASHTIEISYSKKEDKNLSDITGELGVSEETAYKIIKIAEELHIPRETILVTVEKILMQITDNDIKGSYFSMLQARAPYLTQNNIKLAWNRIKGADGYEIYGNRCNTKKHIYKYKLIKTIKNGNKKSYIDRKCKKGTYYKYMVRAYKIIDGKKVTIAVSKTIHVTTTGGKNGNAKSVKVNKKKVSLKTGKGIKLKASEIKESKPLRHHREVSYESSAPDVATVSKKGLIKAKKKGKCTIFAYAQNGIYKKVKVTVK